MGNMINSSLFEMQMIASQIFIFFYFFNNYGKIVCPT